MEISKILEKIREHKVFLGIKRQQYAYDLSKAREAVMAIGRSRTPRFALDATNTFAYDNLIKWVMGDPSMQCLDPETRQHRQGRLDAGIYIAGNTGTGKSWLLDIMSAFCLVDNPVVTLGDVTRPLRWRSFRADAICDEYAAKGSVDRYKSLAILGIQDFGSEPRETLYMGNRLQVLGSIIESRGDRTDLLTLITSNYPISHPDLEAIYGSRVVSRLQQMCNYFEIRGADRRKT